jgi:hypothetical protein
MNKIRTLGYNSIYTMKTNRIPGHALGYKPMKDGETTYT